MDPITSIFNFLSTPVGQQILSDLVKVDAALATTLGSLIKGIFAKEHK